MTLYYQQYTVSLFGML